MTSRLSASRIGAAVLGASLALLASALPASAEVHVKPKSDWDQKGAGVFLEGKGEELTTSLIGLEMDRTSTKVQAYCVELPTELKNGRGLKEVPWDKHPNPTTKFKENAGKIAWVLEHTYPLVKAKDLGTVVGKDDLDENEAIGATQAAIWHFSDGAKLDKGRVENGDITALYDYLTTKAEQATPEPTPTLTVEPKEKAGNAGDLIGPFTVTTTAGEVVLKADLPEGVVLTDKDGNPLADPKAGTLAVQAAGTKTEEFYVKVPAGTPDGRASFSVEANAKLTQGRLFVSSNDKLETQSLVVAFPAEVPLTAKGSVSWAAAPVSSTPPVSTTTTAPPTSTSETVPSTTESTPTTTTTPVPAGGSSGDLADTGASIFVPLIIGIVLIGGGAGALLVMRRRKSAP
jgi:TQXA domain-containing protein/LPXTG-motif cell wall-anchored protein